ncbi:hypothetical protein LJC03_05250, partial [Methanobrevibacter sp. OttesenSCG-928-I08]|nr:hypothetical protein [Methanobrevibacter sp. OttesenSCG-928-I08]
DMIIRPIMYLFLMGSSKGKDVLFFSLMGLILILSNLKFIKSHLTKNNLYLKIAICLCFLLGVIGIILEILMRNSLNIDLNTIFISMNPEMASTSILHSHVYKSVLGNLLETIMGSIIPSSINLGNSLYPYIPPISNLIVLIFPIIFIFIVLAIQKRSLLITILLSFFGTCGIIGILDGGFFSTPAIIGICGLILIDIDENYLNHYYNKIFKNRESMKINLPQTKEEYKSIIKKLIPFLVVIIILTLRLSITLIGANTEYYEINISNLKEEIDFKQDYSTLKIVEDKNTTNILISNKYNENELLNNLSSTLKNKCDYFTVSWNGYSYF